MNRRVFLGLTSAAALGLLHTPPGVAARGPEVRIFGCGPASRYMPRVRACFVRRQGEYGMRWPGAVYDGESARRSYARQAAGVARDLRCQIDLRETPLYTPEEVDAWLTESAQARADGLLVVLLDRQEHAWPAARKAVESGIPAVVFSPVGSSFTTNTAPLAELPGGCICATDDFEQVRYGVRMLCARAKLRETRCAVIKGAERKDVETPLLGTKLRYVPAADFLAEYESTPADDALEAMAGTYMRHARHVAGATRQDVVNGLRSYLVAGRILEREDADAISMDCLGALGKTDVSLPCIAWSRMNDDGIPAACEADVGAILTHCIVQYLFDRPGFQQDPVAETARDAIIGAHCSCPTRLNGFDQPPEPYDIGHHHGMRDAVPKTHWREVQRVTCADVELDGDTPARMLISAGTVLENVAVPPAGGCVVSVMVKFDGDTEALSFPGFHQVFFYGDFVRELRQFCQLAGLPAVVV